MEVSIRIVLLCFTSSFANSQPVNKTHAEIIGIAALQKVKKNLLLSGLWNQIIALSLEAYTIN